MEHKDEIYKDTKLVTKFDTPKNLDGKQGCVNEQNRPNRSSEDLKEGICKVLTKWKKIIASCIDLKLLRNPKVYLYCLSQSLALIAMYVPLYFLPHMMIKERYISRLEAGNIIPIFGVGSIIGRILSGVFVNYVKNSSVAVCCANFMFLSGCCFGYVFCHSYIGFASLNFINGLLFGATFVLIPLTLIEIFGAESITDTYGLVMLSSGITVTFGLPILGKLDDTFHTDKAAFFMAGSSYFICSVLSFLLLFFTVQKVN